MPRAFKLLKDCDDLDCDLLLIDVRLGPISGFELANIIRKTNTKVGICFISAFRNYFESLVSEYPNLDCKCFIQKPIGSKELIYRVNEILTKRMS